MCGAIYNMDDKVYITQMESAYKIIEDTNKQLDDKDLEDFCESTSIKNQLKLDVTIF